jgi:hypothetical protein
LGAAQLQHGSACDSCVNGLLLAFEDFLPLHQQQQHGWLACHSNW